MAEDDPVIVKSDNKAMQAERSPNTFFVLVVSLAALAVAGVALLWFFGLFGP